MTTASLELLKQRLDLCTPKVRRNVTIQTPMDLKQPHLYHIAWRRFKYLVPNISKRAASTEDNTLPRIHTSTTFFGCILGYAQLFWDVQNEITGTKPTANDYKGGFYLYSIPFEYALKPTNKLVYDADYTNEHWLISYSKQTQYYTPATISRFFFTEMKILPFVNGRTSQVTIYLQVAAGAHIRIDEKTPYYTPKVEGGLYLGEGYYRLIVQKHYYKREVDMSLISYVVIPGKEFEKNLSYHTSKLSLERQSLYR